MRNTILSVVTVVSINVIIYAIGMIISASPVLAKEQSHCRPGQSVGGIATLVSVSMQEDGYLLALQINNEKTRSTYYLKGATQKTAQNAGQLIGTKLEFHGTVTASRPDCTVLILTNWDYSAK